MNYIAIKRTVTWGMLALPLLRWFQAAPAHAAAVTVSGRQILIGGTPFQTRAVCYAPTPIGGQGDLLPYGDYFTSSYSLIYNRDLPQIRQMGANCLRIYGWDPSANHMGFLDAAFNNGQRPIYVLLNRWVNPETDWSNNSAVDAIVAEWVTLVANVKSHPAVLGYLIGNEVEWANGNRQKPAFWAALNRVAGSIRQQDTNHLISTALGDSPDLTGTIASVNATMTNFNAWCVQVYRGNRFGTLFADYAGASSKPLLVTEFGMDAYDRRTAAEYADTAAVQAEYVASLWNELAANTPVASGGCVFEWADEWWKSGSPTIHNVDGWENAAFPDRWADEEWWGINRISPGSSGAPNVLHPRAVSDQLRALWTARLSTTLGSPGQIQVVVQGAAGQTAVLQMTTNLQTHYWVATVTNRVPFTNTISTSAGQPTFFRAELR
jgi:hypothetical protein